MLQPSTIIYCETPWKENVPHQNALGLTDINLFLKVNILCGLHFFWHNNITLIRNLDDYTQRFLIMNLIAYQICHIFSLIISLFYIKVVA